MKWDLGMVCHTPPLENASAITHA